MDLYNLLRKEITLEELLNYHNANITEEQLTKNVNAFVFCYRGIYNIVVNSNLSNYKKKKAIIHELAHIELSQFEQIDNDLFAFKIDRYEDEADRYIKLLLETINILQ